MTTESIPREDTALPAPEGPDKGRCPNCGTELYGRFCFSCGQRAEAVRQPVKRIVGDTLTELLGVDGRFWRTAGVLLFRPGRLTADYVTGKRYSYIRPLRIYLLASLSFFFLVTVLDPVGRTDFSATRPAPVPVEPRPAAERTEEITGEIERVEGERARVADLDHANEYLMRLEALEAELVAEGEGLANAPPDSLVVPQASDLVYNLRLAHGPTTVQVGLADWLPRSPAVRRVESARTQREAQEALTELARSTIKRFATMMFIMLPLFALLLKMVYIRRDWYYSEHLVFALHVHAFAFVVLSVVLFLALLASGTVAQGAIKLLLLAVAIYFLVAQRVVYRQGVIKGLIKSAIVGWIYLTLLSIGVFAALAVATAIG